jgi:hypothetical protein
MRLTKLTVVALAFAAAFGANLSTGIYSASARDLPRLCAERPNCFDRQSVCVRRGWCTAIDYPVRGCLRWKCGRPLGMH